MLYDTAEQTDTTAKVIEDIVTYYGCYGEEADGKVQDLLTELDGMDIRQGKLWKDIMDYWDYANHDLAECFR